MSTITKERAELKAFITGFLSDPAHDNQSSRSLTAEVFRIALASLEAEPVAYIRDGFRADGVHFCGGIITAEEHERTKPALSDRYTWKHQPLYTAPPAPVSVPDGEWGIDHSAGRPILVYKGCSVIEAEDAEYVLRLIAKDGARAAPSAPVFEIKDLEHFISFWKKVQAGQMQPGKNDIDHTVWFLEGFSDLTAPPAPVSVPDDVSGPLAHAYKELTPTSMRNHIDVFERYGIYPDGSAGIQAMRIALDGMTRRAAMLQGADCNSFRLPDEWHCNVNAKYFIYSPSVKSDKKITFVNSSFVNCSEPEGDIQFISCTLPAEWEGKVNAIDCVFKAAPQQEVK
ncbi:hypothetical protein RVX78_002108 [Enterobacter cloacae]|nr:hypothetical protein [Enterobacter cloacae]